MRYLFLISLVFTYTSAYAQRSGEATWLEVDGTYNSLSYSDDLHSQKGRIAGVRGDLGIGLTELFGLSVFGSYMDGNTNYDGTTLTGSTLKTVTSDYISEVGGMVDFFFGPVVVSGGAAQREWYDTNGSYRERQITQYFPTTITMSQQYLYVKLEADFWNKGHTKAYMSDVSAGEHDVDLAQTSGRGYGAEIGVMIPNSMHFMTRVFLAYHRWDLGDSAMKNDGVYNIQIAKNNLTQISAGLGVSF